MMRMHVHVGVDNLDTAIAFYSTMFGAAPTRVEKDYAKWMLEDPRVNFAISLGHKGLSHLGIQAETQGEMDALEVRAKTAGESVLIERQASCCYAKSDKAWVEDPAGLKWEQFLTSGHLDVFGSSAKETIVIEKSAAAFATAPKAAASTSGGCCG